MAVLLPATASFHRAKINRLPLPKSFFLLGVSPFCSLYTSNRTIFSPPIPLNRRLSLPFPCQAAKPGPQSDPSPGPPRIKGLAASLSKFQDRMQIFFAVLFWMSLFFWTCVMDDRNRPNKGSRFRK